MKRTIAERPVWIETIGTVEFTLLVRTDGEDENRMLEEVEKFFAELGSRHEYDISTYREDYWDGVWHVDGQCQYQYVVEGGTVREAIEDTIADLQMRLDRSGTSTAEPQAVLTSAFATRVKESEDEPGYGITIFEFIYEKVLGPAEKWEEWIQRALGGYYDPYNDYEYDELLKYPESMLEEALAIAEETDYVEWSERLMGGN